jgi:predicted glycosyltransferase involved in capsule biosynthesis
MRLSLITPYADRFSHLLTQLDWWQSIDDKSWLDWIIVEVAPEPSIDLQRQLEAHQVKYRHLPCTGPFHKTKALNLGLQQSQGDWIVAFDVDLIPIGDTLDRHFELAMNSPQLLVTGYRLMAATATVDVNDLDAAIADATIGPEDQTTALRKQLLKGECFGVMPLFARRRLQAIGGWDETFIGWGAEDQDVIERYLTPAQSMCRVPELVYLHLQHDAAPNWNDAALTDQNRQYYYQKQSDRTDNYQYHRRA